MKKMVKVRRTNTENEKYSMVLELSNACPNTVLPQTMISCNPASGVSPYLSELFVVVFLFLQEICPSYLQVWHRDYPYRIIGKRSEFGTHRYFIEEAKTQDFPMLHFIIHESSKGKINEKVNMNLRDFLGLGVALSYLSVDCNGKYYLYKKGEDLLCSLNVKFIEPRDISAEAGWIPAKGIARSLTWL